MKHISIPQLSLLSFEKATIKKKKKIPRVTTNYQLSAKLHQQPKEPFTRSITIKLNCKCIPLTTHCHMNSQY